VYKGLTPPPVLHMKCKFYEKTIYSLLKKTIGIENGRFFPTAGAAIPPAVQEFVLSVGINMVAGYGLTESMFLFYNRGNATLHDHHISLPDVVSGQIRKNYSFQRFIFNSSAKLSFNLELSSINRH
jgi:acyl-CoA synthetase (AMP-forming)/AMP-acid ligase II